MIENGSILSNWQGNRDAFGVSESQSGAHPLHRRETVFLRVRDTVNRELISDSVWGIKSPLVKLVKGGA